MSLEEQIRISETPAPAPGLYPGIDFDTYASWDAVNQTILNRFHRTPAHVLHEIQTGGRTTPALELGWLTHLATFEPDRYKAGVVAAPRLDKRTKKGKQIWADLEAGNPEKLVVRFDDDEKARAMALSVRSHPTAGLLLSSRGGNEISVTWHEKIESGVLVKCKARLDRYGYLNECPAIIELKTARNAGRREFEKSIFNFGYHVQATHYLTGLETLHPLEPSGEFRRFIFIVVESEPPHLTAVYELEGDDLEEGYSQRNLYLLKWMQCVESGVWPGYPDGIQTVGLPPWAKKTFVDE